jgi:hypothetical protein
LLVAKRVADKDHTLEKIKLKLELFNPDLNDPPKPPASLKVTAPSYSTPDFKLHATHTEQMNMPRRFSDMSLDSKTQEKTWRDTQRDFKRPQIIHREVKGLHAAYLFLLDAFSGLIEELFHIDFTVVEDSVAEIKGEETMVCQFEHLLLTMLKKQGRSPFLKEVADVFTDWEAVFGDLEDRIEKKRILS